MNLKGINQLKPFSFSKFSFCFKISKLYNIELKNQRRIICTPCLLSAEMKAPPPSPPYTLLYCTPFGAFGFVKVFVNDLSNNFLPAYRPHKKSSVDTRNTGQNILRIILRNAYIWHLEFKI